jgi:hypothetical protein
MQGHVIRTQVIGADGGACVALNDGTTGLLSWRRVLLQEIIMFVRVVNANMPFQVGFSGVLMLLVRTVRTANFQSTVLFRKLIDGLTKCKLHCVVLMWGIEIRASVRHSFHKMSLRIQDAWRNLAFERVLQCILDHRLCPNAHSQSQLEVNNAPVHACTCPLVRRCQSLSKSAHQQRDRLFSF